MRTTLQHPGTPTLTAHLAGEAIAPLWVSPSGRTFYPIAGGAPDGGDGGSGGDSGSGGDGGSGGDDGSGGDGGSGGDDGSADGGGSGGKSDKFESITSQEDFDRRISGRLAQERKKYADYEDLKKKAAAHDKALEAAKTEQEKAVDAARKEGETTATERSNARLVQAEARALAAEAKFRNPGLAVQALDLGAVKVGDDGEVDTAEIKAKLDELARSDPYLVDDGKKTGPKPDKSQGGGDGDDKASVTRGRDRYLEKHPSKNNS